MQPDRSTIVQRSESLLATHTVLRNTYMLLSLTLLFSAAIAGFAVMTNAPMLNPILVLVGYIGLLMLTNVTRNSGWGLVSVFAFTGFMGYTLGPMLSMYIHAFSNGTQIIMTAFGATGVIFLALSGYVLTTKKDFSFLGGFLFIGMIVAILASVAGLFFSVPGLQLAISSAVILLMSGFILFDTSRIVNGGERNYIMATISLYLSIFNIFVHLLHLLGALTGRE